MGVKKKESRVSRNNKDVPWSLGVANHATKVSSMSEGHGYPCIAAFQQILCASTSWSRTRGWNHWSMGVWRPCGLEAPHRSAGRLCLCREIGPCRSVEVEDMGLNKERARTRIAPW